MEGGGAGRGFHGLGGGALLQVAHHVLLEDPPAEARPLNLRRGDALFLHEALRGGHGQRLWGGLLGGLGGGLGLGLRLRRPRLEKGDGLPHPGGLPGLLQDLLQGTGEGGGELQGGLVGDELHQGLVLGEALPFSLKPSADLHFHDAFAHGGHLEFLHGYLLT